MIIQIYVRIIANRRLAHLMKLNKIITSIITTLWAFKRLQKRIPIVYVISDRKMWKNQSKSISNKFDQPKLFLQGKIDILIVTETILYSTFSTSQFMIDGHSEPYCFHWNRNSGGVLIHIREDKLSNLLADRKLLYDIEEIFELN